MTKLIQLPRVQGGGEPSGSWISYEPIACLYRSRYLGLIFGVNIAIFFMNLGDGHHRRAMIKVK